MNKINLPLFLTLALALAGSSSDATASSQKTIAVIGDSVATGAVSSQSIDARFLSLLGG